MTPFMQTLVASLSDHNLVSVTLEYRSGPGLHDYRHLFTSMSGAQLAQFTPPEGTRIVGLCSLDDDWD